jgi:hypothetical protein
MLTAGVGNYTDESLNTWIFKNKNACDATKPYLEIDRILESKLTLAFCGIRGSRSFFVWQSGESEGCKWRLHKRRSAA